MARRLKGLNICFACRSFGFDRWYLIVPPSTTHLAYPQHNQDWTKFKKKKNHSRGEKKITVNDFQVPPFLILYDFTNHKVLILFNLSKSSLSCKTKFGVGRIVCFSIRKQKIQSRTIKNIKMCRS